MELWQFSTPARSPSGTCDVLRSRGLQAESFVTAQISGLVGMILGGVVAMVIALFVAEVASVARPYFALATPGGREIFRLIATNWKSLPKAWWASHFPEL